jgi:hypothetical protein
MYPVRVISLNNGWEKLTIEKPEEWRDIQQALAEITPTLVERPSLKLKKSGFFDFLKGNNIDEYNASYQTELWNLIVQQLGWELNQSKTSSIDIDNMGAGVSASQNIKNMLASRMICCNRTPPGDFTRHLILEAPQSFRIGLYDCSVILVPCEDLFKLFNPQGHGPFMTPFLEKTCRTHLADLLLIYNTIPSVIIFFSQQAGELTVEEVPTLLQQPSNNTTIERSIEFAPEYYQAGVGILSYFGEVLRKKHPDINTSVRIEQSGTVVRMHIESPSGTIEIIEKELEKYALVVAAQALPESMYDNPVDVLGLKNKLEITQLEVKQAHDLLQLTRDVNSQTIFNLKEEVSSLRQQIGTQLNQTSTLIHLVGQQVASTERLQLAQIGHSSTLFRDLLGEAHGNQVVLMALRSLEYNLMSGIATVDVQDQIQASLTTIQQSKPSLLTRIAGQMEGAGYGAAAGYVLDWIGKHVQ